MFQFLTLMPVNAFQRGCTFVALVMLGMLATACARAAELDYPIDVAARGDLVFVADRYLPGIWKLTDNKLELYFQGEKKFRTPLNAVRCLAIDAKGRLLAGDSATRQVYRFEEGQPRPLLKGSAGIGIPMALAVTRDGTIYIADLETQRVWKTGADGGEPQPVVQIPGIRSLALDAEDRLWVLTNTEQAIVRVSAEGKVEPRLKTTEFVYPQHILVAASGDMFVSDGYAATIWKVAADGPPTKWASGQPLQHPVGIAQAGDRLLVTDSKQRAVLSIDATGKVSRLAP